MGTAIGGGPRGIMVGVRGGGPLGSVGVRGGGPRGIIVGVRGIDIAPGVRGGGILNPGARGGDIVGVRGGAGGALAAPRDGGRPMSGGSETFDGVGDVASGDGLVAPRGSCTGSSTGSGSGLDGARTIGGSASAVADVGLGPADGSVSPSAAGARAWKRLATSEAPPGRRAEDTAASFSGRMPLAVAAKRGATLARLRCMPMPLSSAARPPSSASVITTTTATQLPSSSIHSASRVAFGKAV